MENYLDEKEIEEMLEDPKLMTEEAQRMIQQQMEMQQQEAEIEQRKIEAQKRAATQQRQQPVNRQYRMTGVKRQQGDQGQDEDHVFLRFGKRSALPAFY